MLMRQIIAALVGATALSVACVPRALAADMPIKAAPSAVVAYNWAGFYVGANAGGAWGKFDPSTSAELSPTGLIPANAAILNALGSTLTAKSSGFTGGLQ